ncbi:hypothetical protein [Alkalibacterium iburiense]|uniref:hypothetical protein n=1 Tax=Alkalibacterium iburiense TaxID=290589 RepID=UPI0031D990D7
MAVGTVSESQGVRREAESEERRTQMLALTNRNFIQRLNQDGRACQTKRSPILPESCTVDGAVT